jgi:hypothetical protein
VVAGFAPAFNPELCHYDRPPSFFGCGWKPRYDWLFSGWADYWNWRARIDPNRLREPVTLDPNLFKAIAWRETWVGAEEQPKGLAHVITLTNAEINQLQQNIVGCLPGDLDEHGGCPKEKERILPVGNIDRERALTQMDLRWGNVKLPYKTMGMDLPYNANEEVGAAMRMMLAYHALAVHRIESGQQGTEQNPWMLALKSIETQAGGEGYTSCSAQQIWDVYTTGKARRYCEDYENGSDPANIPYYYVWVTP